MREIYFSKHQKQLIQLPFQYSDIEQFFLVGGYGCGKTTAMAFLILRIAYLYRKTYIKVGIGSTTLTLLRKTLISQVENLLISTGTAYNFDKQQNVLRIGTVEFILLGLEQPQTIFAYSLNIFICDEIDELPQDVAIDAFGAVQQRTRDPLPYVPGGRQVSKWRDSEGMDHEEVRPFTVFATTAQGYRGMYHIIENLKEAHTNHILIKGRTIDNKSLSRGYYTRLYKLFNENERKAFLEGEFVNLTAGRVYPEYDEARNMVTPFPIEPTEIIYVGQDINTGFSKATAWIVRNKIIYCIKEWSFKSIADAPRIIRNDFPTQEIYHYPDASGKEIMGGYRQEFEEFGINVRIGSINPSVIDRIMIVNKLFMTSRAMIFSSLKMLPMALKTRQYTEKGDPEKGNGENSPDHICVVGETLVVTKSGEKQIKDIVAGDYVLTRKGFKKVIASGCTGEKTVHKYFLGTHEIEGTPDHNVITDKGKKELQSLTRKDIVFILSSWRIKLWNKLNLTALYLENTQIRQEEMTAFIINAAVNTSSRELDIYIGKYGSQKTERFLMDLWYTIKTRTLKITRLTTLFWLRVRSIIVSILKNGVKLILRNEQLILKKHVLELKNGTEAKKVVPGTRKMLWSIHRRMKKLRLDVKIAAKSLKGKPSLLFALIIASLKIGDNLELTTRKENVPSAKKNLPVINIQRQDFVPFRVEKQTIGEWRDIKKVYNLTVEDAHEYFANGILVANCDSAEYANYRIVGSHEEFEDLWGLSKEGRKK